MDPLSGIRLRSATLADIDRLVSDAVPESLYLDYKQELHLDNRDEKKEFLRDITAFANAEGGLLVYGVEEDRDSNGKPNGVPRAAPGTTLGNRDGDVLSIEHLLRDGIDERLPSYELQTLVVSGNDHIVLIRVPPSLRSPHMVILGGERRFHMRMNGGKQDMSTAQLRDVVMKTRSIEERVQRFVDDRLERLSALGGGRPYWALHLVPLLRSAGTIDVTQEETVQTLSTVLLAAGGGSPQHCLEGYRVFHRDSDGNSSHGLAFRDGAIEFFDQESVSPQEPTSWFVSQVVHQLVARCLKSGLALYENGPLVPPLAVCLTFVGLEGYRLPNQLRRALAGPAEPISSEPVVVTDVTADPNCVLRLFMDVVWNAFGQARCPAYDNNNNYIGYRH